MSPELPTVVYAPSRRATVDPRRAADAASQLELVDRVQVALHRRWLAGTHRGVFTGVVVCIVLGLATTMDVNGPSDSIAWQQAVCWSIIGLWFATEPYASYRAAKRGVLPGRRRHRRTGDAILSLAGSLVGFPLLCVTVLVATPAGGDAPWWVVIPAAVVTLAFAVARDLRWHRSFARPPKLVKNAVVGSRPFMKALEDDGPLAVAATLALVKWATADVIADATGFSSAEVAEHLDTLWQAELVDHPKQRLGTPLQYRLSIGKGRGQYARRIRHLEALANH